MGGVCEKCGHDIEWHGPNGCDFEIRDYGDMDCGCTAYEYGSPVTVPASRPADDALDEQIEMLRHMIRSSRPHSGSEEAHDAWDDAIDKAYGVLDTVRSEVERLRRERDELGPFFVRDMARLAGLPDDASMDEIYSTLRALLSRAEGLFGGTAKEESTNEGI